MSEQIKHECGIALIRLLKPYQFYIDKYGTPLYGLDKLFLLMEKQRNRGQDGAGVAVIKSHVKPGTRYISRYRSADKSALTDIFKKIQKKFRNAYKHHPEKYSDAEWLIDNVAFSGELLLGHLRYGTHGGNSQEHCHPFLRQNNWKCRNLVMAGNFNMTNNDELFAYLQKIGQHPKENSDSVTVLEKIGHFLDEENQRLFDEYKDQGYENPKLTDLISENLDIKRILVQSANDFDGGYVMAGLVGNGDAFVLRDEHGIRPGYYYADDEIIVVASERPPIQAAMGITPDKIKELDPGGALIIKQNGTWSKEQILATREKTPCSFERIYFSRGNDFEIYEERKKLGYLLAPAIMDAIDSDIENTVFSFIPNTAETAWYGMVKGVEDSWNELRVDKLAQTSDPAEIKKILDKKVRIEKVTVKDVKLRTFITQDSARDDMVSNVYDITYGQIKDGVDTLVMIDDSIVRGTTLKKSIIKNLDRLNPKRIVIVSTAPQIRYPDCYGIDMSKMNDFIAFRAMIELLKENKKEDLLEEIYDKAKQTLADGFDINEVRILYKQFTAEQISDKIAELITDDSIKAEVKVIYQTVENLHQACPNHKGDWYFTGNYPTRGGNRVVNKAFVNFMEGKLKERAY